MRPIRPGARGPAVEDIQRRLLSLGYDLGPTGVDGVFLGLTAEAVRAFQQQFGLSEDSVVSDETWSALVDASFTFGDRTLYLRLPHFHGRDVRVLQQALNALGFACGATDGIFGAFTERAVREFQRNAGLRHDGIVGPGTVRTILNLRHVWEGKEGKPHSAAQAGAARAAEVLAGVPLLVAGDDEAGRLIAVRIVNLALATTDLSRLRLREADEPVAPDGMLFRLCGGASDEPIPGRPHVRMSEGELVRGRLATAVAIAHEGCREVVLELGGSAAMDELEQQRTAVRVLDVICASFD